MLEYIAIKNGDGLEDILLDVDLYITLHTQQNRIAVIAQQGGIGLFPHQLQIGPSLFRVMGLFIIGRFIKILHNRIS